MFEPNFETKTETEKKDYGEFILGPLPSGFGHTLGNALRRVLLTSLSGAAVTQIKIKGAKHQFTTLPGLKEDVVELILNIKQIRVKSEGEEPVKMTLDAKGPGEVMAGDIKAPATVKIANPNLVLGHLSNKKSRLQVQMEVEKGFGYQPAKKATKAVGEISLDATFTPIVQVAYEIEPIRVGRRTDLDQLKIKITTDGTIKPRQALESAAQKLVGFFKQIYQPVVRKKEEEKEEVSAQVKKTSIEGLGLPTRVTNTLIKAKIKKVGDLLEVEPEELLEIKNFGPKSLEVLQEKLSQKGVELES